MNYIKSLEVAKEQFILSLYVRSICSGHAGVLESKLISTSLGPYHIDVLEDIDRDRAAWSLELISTQQLAVSLDTALGKGFGDSWRKKQNEDTDYFTFVRCLRNAFAHNPYNPKWELRDPGYRRLLSLEDDWGVDLTHCHEKSVEPQQYRYASGLLRLVERGIDMLDANQS